MTPASHLLLLGVCLIVLAGCGGPGASPAGSTPQRTHVVPATTVSESATSQALSALTPAPALATPTVSPSPPLTPTGATPTPRPTPPPRPPHLVSATLRPNSVTTGGSLTANVVTSGRTKRVEVYLGSGSPTAPPPVTYPLVKSSPGTWTQNIIAPSVPGEYHFTVGLYDRAGRRTVVDRDGWNVLVTSVATSAPVAQPFPSDLPLAPPFSYGDPVPAVFSAQGQTVSGSEVLSNTRSDVAASVVANFYLTRLPRAGWSVDPSSVPAPAATSFSIVATKAGAAGTRVCIVQYAASTIHIFYGTLSG